MRSFRITLSLIFVVILLPTLFLLFRSWEHLQTEASFGQKEKAYLLHQLLNQRIYDDLAIEERRSYSEYRFIRAVQVIGGEEVTLSELAAYPVKSHYAGMVGHFQLDPDGTIRTPVLPDGLLDKIAVENRSEREELRREIRIVLETMDLRKGVSFRQVMAHPYVYKERSDTSTGAKTSSKLQSMLGEDRQFERRFETASPKEAIVFDVESDSETEKHGISRRRSTRKSPLVEADVFDVEIEPFQATFNNEYIVFHRNVWRQDQRFLQGYVVNLEEYLANLIYKEIRISSSDQNFRMEFGDGKEKILMLGANVKGKLEVLLETQLQYPLQEMNFAVSLSSANRPPGGGVIIVLGFTIVLVLAGGLYGVYRITASQMIMSAKRQDFISAVSHELKTPLTSIRMYAEMLQNKWVVSDEKRQHYYATITSETERLTRLIHNVLNISNLEKHQWPMHLQLANPAAVLKGFAQKYTPTVEQAGFVLETQIDNCHESIYLDLDAVYQMLMNLIENSIKFAANAEIRIIELGLKLSNEEFYFYVRDFGPGISPSERDKVFQDFYIVENEMTRRTSGVGIGLSLVKKLSSLLNIKMKLSNKNPGLQVEMHLPRASRF